VLDSAPSGLRRFSGLPAILVVNQE
jgi:hypothetical protein